MTDGVAGGAVAPAPDALLAALDDEQRVAAEALRGPVCILAGAGAGKTRAITHRIAYGVATGVYTPERVMALTFTNRAAGELRSRLRELGVPGVTARTFHAAALAQLGYFWPQLVGGRSPELVASKGRLLAEAAEGLKFRLDTAALRDAAAEIEWRKTRSIGIDDYAALLAERVVPAGLSVDRMLALHARYEQLKDERRQLDFEDVLLAVTGMVRAEASVAAHIREQYRFFVVDEYQDVSPLQAGLLEAWLGGRSELCVVGDASQTIYTFAGADVRYLQDFPVRYPDAAVVRLDRSYRSAPEIVETANALMWGRESAIHLRPVSAPSGVLPVLAESADDAAEAAALVRAIRAQTAAGIPYTEIAVLFRYGAQAQPIEAALTDADVPYRVHGATRFFDRPEVRQAVLQLRAASISIVGEPLFKSVSDVLRSLGWTQVAPEGGGAVRAKWDALDALMSLADRAPAGTTFRQFTDDLSDRMSSGHEPPVDAVTLATLHAVKGLEWDAVHIVGVSEGMLPVSHATTPDEVEEERRLLYVGITRARRALRLSWARSGQRREARRPSRFLGELRSHMQDEPREAR